MKKEIVTAAFLMIGDEILSGRTADKNLNFLAKNLTAIGIRLRETRVVGDFEDQIIPALNELRKKYDYVFTSGGIGPTHDDITSATVAKAFGVELILDKTAKEILEKHYGKDLNEARLKMGYIPRGASLLDNPVSSAPGFRIENVFVMAGVPKIFEAMFDAASKELETGKKVLAKELTTDFTEGVIAKDLTDLQKKYPQIAIGSYPFVGGTSLVFRGIDYEAVENAHKEMNSIVEHLKK